VRLAIIGSRGYRNREAVVAYVQSLPLDTVIVTGGWPSLSRSYDVVEATQGVDRFAYVAAEQCGLVTVLVSGSKTKHGHLAGVQRNPIVEQISDCVAAFWDLRSPGTGGTLRMFAHANKGAIVFNEAGQSVDHWRQLLPTR